MTTTNEKDVERDAHAEKWFALATVHGFNEMAKKAESLGEKVLCRMLRNAAVERCRELGVEIRDEGGSPVVLVIGERPAALEFRESDLEAMRKLVGDSVRTEERAALVAEIVAWLRGMNNILARACAATIERKWGGR